MNSYETKTLEYYENNAREFVEGTINADMSNLYEHFLSRLPVGVRILDLGCGSGRDSKYFLSKGYKVEAIDGSIEVCKLAANYIGQEVKCVRFEELKYSNEFAGIWACASLLHVEKEHMQNILGKVRNAMLTNGILFTCYKYGDEEMTKDGRFFSNYNEDTIKELFNESSGFKILETFVSEDVRTDRSTQKWMNVVAQKI